MTVLLAFFRIMNDTELKERYAQEPWGKLLIEMGMEPYDTESSARRVAEYAAERLDKLRGILRALMENPHIDLGDQIYKVRESEGEGWDGQHVKAWSDAVTAAQKILQANVKSDAPT